MTEVTRSAVAVQVCRTIRVYEVCNDTRRRGHGQ